MADWFRERHIDRLQFDRVLERMDYTEIVQLLQWIEHVISRGRRTAVEVSRTIDIRADSASSRFRLIALFVQRRASDWTSRQLTERVAALKDLVWLRGRLWSLSVRLGKHRLVQPDMTQTSEPPSGVQAAPDQAARAAVSLVYQLCLGRTPSEAEVAIWLKNLTNGVTLAEFLTSVHASAEAQERRVADAVLPNSSDGEFVQFVYEAVLGRGITPREIDAWRRQLQSGLMQRDAVLRTIFADAAGQLRARSDASSPDSVDNLSCQIMGTSRTISVADWRRRAQELKTRATCVVPVKVPHARFHIKHTSTAPLVSAIASLYRGGRFVERFMANITSQSCFRDHCELIIIDADSPEQESRVIERYCRTFDNIVYHRVNYRIGIYDAWNIGVKLARGQYCTNTNLDDMRRSDSLELQAATLDNLPFVDVVYQDFLYTFDPDLSFEEIAQFNYGSDLPLVNAANMMYFNSPHNAPMWRRTLHDQVGFFDVAYKSAGDYEFWMRCLAAGKVFYKLNDPHVVYYQNPNGLSTRPGSRGVEEAKQILKTYGRKLVSSHMVMSEQDFLRYSLRLPNVQRQGIARYDAAQFALRSASIRCREMQRVASGVGAQPRGFPA